MERYQTIITKLLMQLSLPREVAEMIYNYNHKEYQDTRRKIGQAHHLISRAYNYTVRRSNRPWYDRRPRYVTMGTIAHYPKGAKLGMYFHMQWVIDYKPTKKMVCSHILAGQAGNSVSLELLDAYDGNISCLLRY